MAEHWEKADIDGERRGLPCRADPLCEFLVAVPSNIVPTVLAPVRDAHELAAHGYVHVTTPLVPRRYDWTATKRHAYTGQGI